MAKKEAIDQFIGIRTSKSEKEFMEKLAEKNNRSVSAEFRNLVNKERIRDLRRKG